jgi:hypothetical protein
MSSNNSVCNVKPVTAANNAPVVDNVTQNRMDKDWDAFCKSQSSH